MANWKAIALGAVGVTAASTGVAYAVMHRGHTLPEVYDMRGKTVLITGGNSGIGKQAAIALAKGGARVLVAARSPQRGSAAVDEIRVASGNDQVELVMLDLASMASVRSAADDIMRRVDRLDVLVNNAGLTVGSRQQTEDGFELTMAVNHLGPFLLTNLLLPLLQDSTPSRIVNVASLAHKGGQLDLQDLMWAQRPFVGLQVYATTKLCNVLFTRELARRLDGTGVTANCLHPGTIRTGFGHDDESGLVMRLGVRIAGPFFLDEERGAATTVFLAGDPGVEGVTGGYFWRRVLTDPAQHAQDDQMAKWLWQASAELVGLDADVSA
jgi:NAD(P)-dependent dehydrogenase (short-subunit alcohol dehydrogenase family)